MFGVMTFTFEPLITFGTGKTVTILTSFINFDFVFFFVWLKKKIGTQSIKVENNQTNKLLTLKFKF